MDTATCRVGGLEGDSAVPFCKVISVIEEMNGAIHNAAFRHDLAFDSLLSFVSKETQVAGTGSSFVVFAEFEAYFVAQQYASGAIISVSLPTEKDLVFHSVLSVTDFSKAFIYIEITDDSVDVSVGVFFIRHKWVLKPVGTAATRLQRK